MITNFAMRFCVIAFPTAAYIGHSSMIVCLVILLVCGLIKAKCYGVKRPLDKKMYVVYAFTAVFLAAIPNVIMDGGRLAALDSPSRYLICAGVLLLLINNKVRYNDYILGMIIGSLFGFLLYPVYCSLILEAPRYGTELFGKQVNILSVAYFSFVSSVVLMTATISYLQDNRRVLAIVCMITSFASLLIGAMSGSKVIIIALPIVVVLFLYASIKLSGRVAVITFCTVLILPVYFYENVSSSQLYNRTVSELSAINTHYPTSTNVRINMFKSGWESFKESPILGLGFERRAQFQKELVQNGKLNLPKDYLEDGRNSLHNEFINSLAKKGILGLLIILILYSVPIYLARALTNRSDKRCLYITCAFVGSMILIGFTEAPLMGVSTSVYYAVNILFLVMMLPNSNNPRVSIASS